jgi:RNA polymerase sigma-70 factor (ECF subfamily)
MKDITDIEIIESIKKGNQSDFSLLIDRHKNKAFSLLKRLLKDKMEAEEVLQDCFLKAFNSLNSFRNESKFSTWFYKIVYNTALTRLSAKKRKVENEMVSIDQMFHLKSDSDYRMTEAKDVSEFLHKAIEQLPENYISIIYMFYLDGMNCEEIAEIMNTTVNNVKVMLYRGRNILRELLEKNNYAKEIL